MFLTIKLCTQLFEIELTICLKMDLALNNLQRMICHKNQLTNQLNYINIVKFYLSIYQ